MGVFAFYEVAGRCCGQPALQIALAVGQVGCGVAPKAPIGRDSCAFTQLLDRTNKAAYMPVSCLPVGLLAFYVYLQYNFSHSLLEGELTFAWTI